MTIGRRQADRFALLVPGRAGLLLALPSDRQNMYWSLSDQDRDTIAAMAPQDQMAAWTIVEDRMSAPNGAPKMERCE